MRHGTWTGCHVATVHAEPNICARTLLLFRRGNRRIDKLLLDGVGHVEAWWKARCDAHTQLAAVVAVG